MAKAIYEAYNEEGNLILTIDINTLFVKVYGTGRVNVPDLGWVTVA